MVARADLEVTLKAIDRASPTVKQLESSIIRFVGAVSASIAALAALTFPIVQATKFDRALRDVQKTTGFADTEIRQLGKDILQLSTTLDQSATSLAGIAAAAGQLGLGTQGTAAILAFSESVARAATTLDLSTDAAARASAKLVNIFQLDIGQVENLFSTINALSNTTTANAGELIDTMARIGSTANLTAQQVGALSATSVDLGVSAEVAGTSLLKVFSRIQSNAQGFADAIGVSLSEFTALPALDRFREFLRFLSTQTDEVQAKLITTLAGGGRIFGLVNKLLGDAGNNFAILDKNLETAEAAFLSGQSAIEEYGNISKALSVQLNILKNNFAALTTSVGQQFIPRLLELTEELTEFLRTDEATQFFRQIGEAAQGFFEIIVKMVRVVANLDIEFQNLLAVLKAIIALQFARILGGIAARLVLAVGSFTGLGAAASVANGPIARTLALFLQSRRAGQTFAVAIRTVTAAITAGIVPALIAAGQAFIAFFPLIAIGVGAAIVVFLAFEEQIKSAFGAIAEFFGFVGKAQADSNKQTQKALSDNIKDLEESSARILAAEKELAQSGNQLPDESFAELIQKDVLLLNDALLIAQKRIQLLGVLAEEAARKAETLSKATVGFQGAVGRGIADLATAAGEAEAALVRVEAANRRVAAAQLSTDEFDPIASADPGASEELLAAQKERTAAVEAQRIAQEKVNTLLASQANRQERITRLQEVAVQAGQEQLLIFEKTVGVLSTDLQQAFKLEVDARQAEAELDGLQKTLANIQTQIEARSTVAAGGGDDAAKLEFAELEKSAKKAEEGITEFQAKVETARAKVDEFTESSLNLGEALVFDRGNKSLSVTEEGLAQVEVFLEGLPDAADDVGDSLEDAFVKGAIGAVRQQAALQELQKEQEKQKLSLASIAKAAESVFNNTATEVRAFTRNVQTSVEELRISLARRPLTLEFKVKQADIREELDTIESERERLTTRLEELEEKSEQTRLLGAFTFEKNKTKTALAELERRGRALEDLERANNRRRLEEEFAAIQNRTNELLTRARQAAEAGKLSEALGLKELAKTQIPDLFKALGQLGDLTTGEGRPLISTAKLEGLLDQVQDLSGQVQTEIPTINEALRDATEQALTDITSATAATSEELKKVTAKLGEMSAAITGFAQAIPRILAGLSTLDISGGRIARGAGTPGVGDTTEAGRNLISGSVDAVNAQRAAAEEQTRAADATTRAAKLLSEVFTAAQTEERSRRAEAVLPNRAGGGIIRGPGTGTSDSILARVSNGEFIMNAATTRFFGSSFFQGLQNFAKGGFSVPSFAGGGFVGNSVLAQAGGPPGSPVNITLPSGDRLQLATGVSTVEDIKRVFSREARKAGRRLR